VNPTETRFSSISTSKLDAPGLLIRLYLAGAVRFS
jgi:hypothetical protein